uniref:Uncharacterized protein n=1 Tax=Peronospora matthiolae TaxID=2874970 RepID=A0AAV1TYU6_9STRA
MAQMIAKGVTAKSAATDTEPVEHEAVGKAAAPDETVSGEVGLPASSRYRAKSNMAARGTNWMGLSCLWLGRDQSSHVRDTEAGRGQFQGNGCKCCERHASTLAQSPTNGASWISLAIAFENLFFGCKGGDAYQKSWG